MKHIRFDEQKVVTDLRAVVATKGPDYVYPRGGKHGGMGEDCVYFEPNGEPSCIIGHVLARHGVTLEDLRHDTEDLNEGSSVAQLIMDGLLRLDGPYERDLRDFLQDVQAFQDRGVPWGPALDFALSRYEKRKQGFNLLEPAGVVPVDHLLPQVQS
jgi:hypothetical protein